MRRLAALGALLALAACAAPAEPPPVTPSPISATGDCAGGVPVADGDQLTEALAGAHPGTVIAMAPGVYTGNFVARTTGTEDAPITLCGPREAVLDGGPVDGDYTLHLDGVTHWQLRGFTVRGGQKGVMVDGGQRVLVEGLLVEGTGDEGIHLRRHSSDNVVRGNTIRDTGLRRDKFGEGVYVGSAESNWCELTDCGPDRSDRNTIEANTISGTTSEAVDIKEGTTGGLLRGNTFDGAGMTAADAWVNVKGNDWMITGNSGTDSPEDGFQVFEILEGWGLDNTFAANTATVNGDGYGFNITRNDERNPVTCDNTVVGAAKGLTSAACT
ncbi:right-handed parallel beta-helix repeat-containing protein [Pseudonocardia saturnea]